MVTRRELHFRVVAALHQRWRCSGRLTQLFKPDSGSCSRIDHRISIGQFDRRMKELVVENLIEDIMLVVKAVPSGEKKTLSERTRDGDERRMKCTDRLDSKLSRGNK